MAFSEYRNLEAHELATLVSNGAVAADDVLDAALAAIAALNPHLNSVIALAEPAAREQIERGLPAGLLHAAPILLKDLSCASKGLPTTFGSRLFASATPWTHDCLIVERLKAAGALIIGRTNSCEFGVSLTTEPAAYGPTHNPHRAGFTPGGSSGGSAAAVASGMTPLAHATDGCGSIRVPAAHCGLVGLKPTRARVSMWPDAGESWAGMSVHHGLTRSVRDTALLLDVIGGPHPGDPYAAPTPMRNFRDEVGAPAGELRIAVASAAPNGLAVDTECIRAVDHAAQLCRSLGHTVERIELDFDLQEASAHLLPIWSSQLWALVEPRYRELGKTPDGEAMEPLSWALARSAREFTANDYLSSVRYIHRVGRDFATLFERFDVLLTPVTAAPPGALGQIRTDHEDVPKYLQQLFAAYPFTVQSNITGCPAISLPLHVAATGLPVGVQFTSPLGHEARLLRLSAQLEAADPWKPRIDALIDRLRG